MWDRLEIEEEGEGEGDSFTEVIIEVFEEAEITAESQGHNFREQPHLWGGSQMQRLWKKEKLV